MNNTIFQDMKAENGAAIFALNDAVVTVSHSKFRECNTTISGGLITLAESNLKM